MQKSVRWRNTSFRLQGHFMGGVIHAREVQGFPKVTGTLQRPHITRRLTTNLMRRLRTTDDLLLIGFVEVKQAHRKGVGPQRGRAQASVAGSGKAVAWEAKMDSLDEA